MPGCPDGGSKSRGLHDGRSEFAARQHPALRHTLEAQADALACGDWVLAHDDGHGAYFGPS